MNKERCDWCTLAAYIIDTGDEFLGQPFHFHSFSSKCVECYKIWQMKVKRCDQSYTCKKLWTLLNKQCYFLDKTSITIRSYDLIRVCNANSKTIIHQIKQFDDRTENLKTNAMHIIQMGFAQRKTYFISLKEKCDVKSKTSLICYELEICTFFSSWHIKIHEVFRSQDRSVSFLTNRVKSHLRDAEKDSPCHECIGQFYDIDSSWHMDLYKNHSNRNHQLELLNIPTDQLHDYAKSLCEKLQTYSSLDDYQVTNLLEANRDYLQILKKRNYSIEEQCSLLYPTENVFDLNPKLIYVPLMNTCSLYSPKTGWGQHESDLDILFGADLLRVKYIRSFLSLCVSGVELKVFKFNPICSNIKAVPIMLFIYEEEDLQEKVMWHAAKIRRGLFSLSGMKLVKQYRSDQIYTQPHNIDNVRNYHIVPGIANYGLDDASLFEIDDPKIAIRKGLSLKLHWSLWVFRHFEEDEVTQHLHGYDTSLQPRPLQTVIVLLSSLPDAFDQQTYKAVTVKEDLSKYVSLKGKITITCSNIRSRHTIGRSKFIFQNLNISVKAPEKFPVLYNNENETKVDAVPLGDIVCRSVIDFFKEKHITYNPREAGEIRKHHSKICLNIIAQYEKKGDDFYDKNNTDIDLKEKKQYNFQSKIWLQHNQLPLPILSRDAIVAYVEGQTSVAPPSEHGELRKILIQLSSDNIPGPYTTMKYEMLRLCTMKTFPGRDRPFAIRIVGAGFYYAGHQDQVICYCCGIRKDNWVIDDIPLLIHQKMTPSCSFLTNNALVNIPIRKRNSESVEVRLSAVQQYDRLNQPDVAQGVSSLSLPSIERKQVNISSGNLQMLVPNEGSSPNQLAASSRQNILDDRQTTGIADSREDTTPKYPHYAARNIRIQSFQRWPSYLRQREEEMAECGFYYAGYGDCVRCFYCGVGLRHWMSEDDPWIEHARWSASCVYVRKIKGEEFVSQIKIATEITEREESTRNNGEANQSPQYNTEAAYADTTKEDSHNKRSNISSAPKEFTNIIGVSGGAVGGAAASVTSPGKAEMQNYLLTDAAQSVLDMGYQPKLVMQAIERILIKNGKKELTGHIIMESVLEIEEEEGKVKYQHQLSSMTKQENESNAKDCEETQSCTSNELKINPEKIMREHRELREATLCKICLDNTIGVVFLPCGHLVTCRDCAPAMRKCPICRTLIKGIVKPFFG